MVSQQQFEERDIRTEQTARDSKVAVDAALQSAKEAVGKQQDANDRATTKSENSFAKLIDQQSELLAAAKSELGTRIEGVKENLSVMQTALVKIQSELSGRALQTKDSRDSIGVWIGVGGLVMGIVGTLIVILAKLT